MLAPGGSARRRLGQQLTSTPRSGTRKPARAWIRAHASWAVPPCRYSSWAITPATFGAAKLVPLQRAQPAVLLAQLAVLVAVVDVVEERADDIDRRCAGVDPRAEVGERGAAAAVEGADGHDAGQRGRVGAGATWRRCRPRRRRGCRRAAARWRSPSAADRRRSRTAPNAITTMSKRCSESAVRPLDGGDDRGVVAVAVARQHAAVVDAGVGALLADDAADERAVPGLDVEAAAAVVVGLVLVVPAPDGLEVAPRAVQDAVVAQPRVGDVAVTGPQPGVEHEHVRRVVAGQRQRRRQVATASAAGRTVDDVDTGMALRRAAARSVLGDQPEVPGHALGEVHPVRAHRAALDRRSARPTRTQVVRCSTAPGALSGRSAWPGRAARSPLAAESVTGPPRTSRAASLMTRCTSSKPCSSNSRTTESGRTRHSCPASSAATAMRRRASWGSMAPSGPR